MKPGVGRSVDESSEMDLLPRAGRSSADGAVSESWTSDPPASHGGHGSGVYRAKGAQTKEVSLCPSTHLCPLEVHRNPRWAPSYQQGAWFQEAGSRCSLLPLIHRLRSTRAEGQPTLACADPQGDTHACAPTSTHTHTHTHTIKSADVRELVRNTHDLSPESGAPRESHNVGPTPVHL